MRILICLISSIFFLETTADDAYFISPPAPVPAPGISGTRDDLGFTVGQSINLTWRMSLDEPINFWLVQDNSNAGSICRLGSQGEGYANELCGEIAGMFFFRYANEGNVTISDKNLLMF